MSISMKEVCKSITIDAPIDTVWSVLTDYKAYPDWNPTIRHLGMKDKVGKSFNLKIKTGSGKIVLARPKLLEFKEKDSYRWQGKVLHSRILTGEHYFKVKDNGDGSTTFTQGEIFNGALVPVLGWLIKDLERSYALMNEALKERCEALAT